MIDDIVKIYKEEADSVLDVEGLFPALAFQPISKNIVKEMQKNGGNALGLTVDRAPLMSKSKWDSISNTWLIFEKS